MTYLDTAMARLEAMVQDRVSEALPFRAIVAGAHDGMVSIRRLEAATAEDELRARVPGLLLSPDDEVLCVQVNGKPVVIGPLQRSDTVTTPPQIGTSEAATGSVGALVARYEVFDAAGASLGFVPIYASVGGGGSSSDQFVRDLMTSDDDWTGKSLAAHVADDGTTWAAHGSAAGVWSWFDGRFYPTTAGIVVASGTPADADYVVSCRYRYLSNTGAVGIAGRIQSGAATCYYAYHNANEWVLARLAAGTPNTIGTGSQTLTAGNDYFVELVMNGTSIVLRVNGSTVVNGTDGNITSAGQAGLRSAAAVTTTTGKHVSRFRAWSI